MKNQYFGDINDYRKYGILRCFREAGFRLGVLWMLTADDSATDGKRTDYTSAPEVWRRYDPDLFDFLRNCIDCGKRGVQHLEQSGLLTGASFHSPLLSDDLTSRQRYLSQGLAATTGCDLLFFDPDNGIEVPSMRSGRRGSCKYVYLQELADAWRTGASLLVFQHYPRSPREEYTAHQVARLRAALPGGIIATLSTAHVLFLAAIQHRHVEAGTKAVALAAKRWWGDMELRLRSN